MRLQRLLDKQHTACRAASERGPDTRFRFSYLMTITFAVEDSFFWTPAFMKLADTVRGAVPGGRLLSSKDLSNVSNKVLPSAVTLLWTGSNV